MKAEEIELDTIPGLPSELPAGERIVWQGRPQWRALARHAFKIRWLAVYFGLFVGARVVAMIASGPGPDGFLQLGVMTVVFSVGLGLCALMAWFQARSGIYTITTHRVVMQVGAACPITWNLPFRQIAAADLTVRDEGDGDVKIRLAPPNRVAWIHMWPHASAGALMRACPTLRCVARPQEVAARLEEAVREWSAHQASAPRLFVDTAIGETTPPAPERPLAVVRLASEGNP